MSACKGDGVSWRPGATLPPTGEGSPQGPKAGLPVMVPEPRWQLGSALCQAGNPPLPGESLPGHFTVFLRTARSLITSPHLPQMLYIPAMLRKCAEPYSISPKRARCSPCQGWQAPATRPSRGEGNGPAPKDGLADLTAGDTALPLSPGQQDRERWQQVPCVQGGRTTHSQSSGKQRGEEKWFPTWWHRGRFGHLWVSP